MTAVGPKMPRMALLDDIGCPDDVRKLTTKQAEDLAEEIRAFLIDKVSRTGGHLGPNLGVVELTIALHRVFDSPHDPIIFDTGHQSYVHKILTGRANGFEKLRQRGDFPGIPVARNLSMIGWKTPTLRPRCLGPRAWPRDFFLRARIAPSSPSLVTER